jgi:prolyl-tRNA synthetase
MGSYGIGPSRVMGTIAEVWSDEKGLVWPESVAPFNVHLVALLGADGKVKKAADELYAALTAKGIEVLYDDRDASAGEKFGDSDLIGIPWRYVISEKTLASDTIELKFRKTGKVEMKKIAEILN